MNLLKNRKYEKAYTYPYERTLVGSQEKNT